MVIRESLAPSTTSPRTRTTRFEFAGGIIAITNVPLRSDPLARALGSRLTVLEHEPSDEEIGAFMRLLALRGHEDMTPGECLEVAEFLIRKPESSTNALTFAT